MPSFHSSHDLKMCREITVAKKKKLEKAYKKYRYELFLSVGRNEKFPFLSKQLWSITKYANISKHEKHVKSIIYISKKKENPNPIQTQYQ